MVVIRPKLGICWSYVAMYMYMTNIVIVVPVWKISLSILDQEEMCPVLVGLEVPPSLMVPSWKVRSGRAKALPTSQFMWGQLSPFLVLVLILSLSQEEVQERMLDSCGSMAKFWVTSLQEAKANGADIWKVLNAIGEDALKSMIPGWGSQFHVRRKLDLVTAFL